MNVQVTDERTTGAMTWASKGMSAPHQDVDTLLELFAAIGLHEMNSVALLDRVDTKFMLEMSRLETLLPMLAREYRVLDIDLVRLNAYQTVYFDSANFGLYMRHYAGATNRLEVRSRHFSTCIARSSRSKPSSRMTAP